MTWQTEMVLIVRHVVDDVETPQDYTDSRLEITVSIAAQLVMTEVDWDKTYVIDTAIPSISPDPTTSTRDDAFINLVSLKASCMIARSEYKSKAATAGIMVKDAQSEIRMGNVGAEYKKRADDMCSQYQQAKLEYQAGNSRAGQAILGPYTYGNIHAYRGNF